MRQDIPAPVIVWFRLDLRLGDQPALAAAQRQGGAVVPVYIWAPEEEGAWPPGSASRWWLRRSLAKLAEALEQRGSRLLLRRGPSLEALTAIARATGAGAIHWNQRCEPAAVARDVSIATELRARGVAVRTYHGGCLFAPDAPRTGDGRPYSVFTPFWRACQAQPELPPALPAPAHLRAPVAWPGTETLDGLGIEPASAGLDHLRQFWEPGEAAAQDRLRRFQRRGLAEYGRMRDFPGTDATSRLSPHLHFGEVSARQAWRKAGEDAPGAAFRRQLAWREFAWQLLLHHPHTEAEPLRPEFARFPWRLDERQLRAWQLGRTGYPLVDAGMRELNRSGWMHNRVRMIAASFLVKHLLLPWQEGARWFWRKLVDADLANNSFGWQWVAGCGADAAPYFRVFNPALQAARFDPAGDYQQRWRPPASQTGLAPMVDHQAARDRALAAYATLRQRRRSPAH